MRHEAIGNSKKVSVFGLVLFAMLFALSGFAQAQQPKVYRLGVLVPGEAWYEIVDGLRFGLSQLGLEEGKQYTLGIRDWKGDAKGSRGSSEKF
jgi:hypothetical protein